MSRTSKSVPMFRPNASTRPVRNPYFFQDPVRLGGMVCAALLMVVPTVHWTLGLFAVGVSQINGIAMILDLVGRGWTSRWGRRTRASVFTSCLTTDWVNTSVCTLVGAMFLMRMFGPPALVTALGWLTLAIAVLPDMRICRLVLPEDAGDASRQLDRGWFFRDPVKLGALAAMTVVCFLDQTSLAFIFVSSVLLQLNSVLLLVDKYLGEVEVSGAAAKVQSRAVRLVLARDGQRLLLSLVPLFLVPLRLGVADRVTHMVVAVIAGLVIVPDVVRMLWLMTAAMFGFRRALGPTTA